MEELEALKEESNTEDDPSKQIAKESGMDLEDEAPEEDDAFAKLKN